MSQPEPASESAAFADHVLRAALGAPGADSTAAGATVLALLVVLLSEGGADAATRILGVEPDQPATFEVRAYSSSAATPEQQTSGLDAEAALRKVLEHADAGVDLVEAVAIAPSGLARRVVESRGGRQPRYLFPRPAHFEGDAGAVARAVSRWQDEALPPQVPGDAIARQGEVALSERDALSRGDDLQDFEPPQEIVDLLRRTVREALEEVTVEVDLGAIETVMASVLGQLVADGPGPSGGPPNGSSVPPAGREEGIDRADLQRLLEAIERPPMPSVDAALATRMLAALEAQSEQAARLALPAAPVAEPPSPAQIADEVAARLRATTAHGPPDDGAQIQLLAMAAERLNAQSALFEDRIRSATRTLEALASDVAADVRGSEDYLGRLTHSVTTIVERLGRRLEGRLDQMPLRPQPVGELAALTERLEAVVAALGTTRPADPIEADAAPTARP